MAFILADRVRETASAPGTSTVTLLGAVTGYQTFSAGIGANNTTYYVIADQSGNNWEVGLGTIGAGGTTLARTTVLASSNSGSLVNFSSGTQDVFCDYAAGKAVYLNSSGNVSALGTITSGVWNGTTVPVAYGGTGVTASSGANSVVLRDSNANIIVNSSFNGFTSVAASGTQIVLTAASTPVYLISGSGGQTIKLPDATTLPNGVIFSFNNNQSSGAITVNNNSNTLVVSVPSGGYTTIVLLSNATAAGSWDRHDQTPSNVSWSTNTLDYAGSITNATWNGNTVAYNRGGTGQSSAFTAGGIVYGSTTSALAVTPIGTIGQVLTSAGAGTPTWTTPTTGTVTSVATAGTVNGLTLTGGPITTTGTVTLGGTLDLSSPPAIGGTTPAAGTFTTITGQTEVLKGTGSNLIQQSQALATSPWSTANGTTVSNNVTTAPDGTTTASKISEPATTTNYFPVVQNPTTVAPSARYTFSFYAKSAERTQAFAANSVSNYTVYFDLSAGTVISGTGASYISSSITSAGSGWYRCSVIFTASTSANPFYSLIGPAVAGNNNYSSTLGYGIYVWGVQLEIGSTANTYIPTTTTAIYGTPTLSFSGVAGLGLQSDGSLYVSPAGTGALQAQKTDSTTTGGNARGANAVDWQTLRNGASQVASALASFSGAGTGNTVSGAYSFNGAGGGNSSSNNYSAVLGGQNNNASGVYSSQGGGYQNTSSGYYGAILNGAFNSTTSNSAVTTQSATMNGTTAVTLSGSNANIKVGQFITGTSISYPNTYVAAISGTSLTLSQAASGSSTSTLSFYTPHGVVVGGGNNQATGSYSFIGGGGDAGTSSNRNVASGAWSFVGGGIKNTASGIGAVICGGGTDGSGVFSNTAGGTLAFIGSGWNHNAAGVYSVIAGGSSNTTSGSRSFVGSGDSNNANGDYCFVSGGAQGTARSIVGNHVFPACNQPIAGSAGVSQTALLVLGVQTTDATATVLRSNTSAASGTNQVILPNNSAYYFKVSVIAGVTGGGNTKAWTLEGAIKRGAGVGTTAIVGTVTTNIVAADAGASTWTVTATADTTNGGLAITVTGQASTTIRWVAKAETAEMTF